MDHVEDLLVAKAAAGGQDDARHHGWVDAVDIDREDRLGALGHLVEGRREAAGVDLARREDMGAPGARVRQVARPALPGPRAPICTRRVIWVISEARRMGLEKPWRTPFTWSRQSMWASTWTMVRSRDPA